MKTPQQRYYEEQQRSLSQHQPSQAETMQRAANMRNIHTTINPHPMVPPPSAPIRPKATINPGLFIAIVDSFILGVWLVFNPDLAIYVGYALTLIPLACIAVVMSGKARRLLR